MRDMFVFDWLFGHCKKESFWERGQRENRRYTGDFHHDDSVSNDYNNYSYIDSAQQDFDDDIDSSMFDDL